MPPILRTPEADAVSLAASVSEEESAAGVPVSAFPQPANKAMMNVMLRNL